MRENNKKTKENIVFNGVKFVIEWYFDYKGHSNALDYFESLTDDEQIKALGLFELMGNIGAIKNKTKFNY